MKPDVEKQKEKNSPNHFKHYYHLVYYQPVYILFLNSYCI